MVCTNLKPTDVANLRLASSIVAPIGLHYLVPEVQLVIAEDSFRKLAAIAAHPVVSKYVTGLFYQADILESLDEEDWIEWVWLPPHHRYSKKQLKEAFREHQRFCNYQRGGDDFNRKMVTAMKELPNLKELTMATQVWPRTKAFEKAFAPGLLTEFQRDVQERPTGLPQMRSLLVGAYRAGLKIERLRCKQVNWRILTQKNKTFEEMKKSLRHLREMSINFSTGIGDEWGPYGTNECRIYLQKSGRLQGFVASAPDLERLEICFGRNEPTYPADFEYVVGNLCWPSLRAVKFAMFVTAEDHFVEFFERHACTIKHVSIDNMSIYPGHWWSVFERIRRVLNLDSVELTGILHCETDSQYFGQASDAKPIKLRTKIQSYLLSDNTDRTISPRDYLASPTDDDSDDN